MTPSSGLWRPGEKAARLSVPCWAGERDVCVQLGVLALSSGV